MRSRYNIDSDISISNNIIAASDTPTSLKGHANFILNGTSDETKINSILVEMNSSGGGLIYFLPGTYNIWGKVDILTGTSNLIFSGSGESTIFKRETKTGVAVGQAVFNNPNSTLTVQSAVFLSSMVSDGSAVQFDTSGNIYDITGYTSGTVVELAGDASGELSGDTFTISTVNHVISQAGEGSHIYIRNLQVDGQNFGDESNANNKGIFINGNSADWTLAHHMGIENCFIQNVKSEASVMDYCQYVHTRNCRTKNSSWAGAGLAQVRFGEISGCRIETSGTVADPSAAGVLAHHYGINVQASSHCNVFNNYIEHPRGGGIGVVHFGSGDFLTKYGSGYNRVFDNHILLCEPTTSVNGIIWVGGNAASSETVGNVIQGNAITRNLERGSGGTWRTVSGTSGIYVKWARDTNILDNYINGFGNTGIYLVDSTARQTYHNGNYVGYFYSNKIFNGGTDTTAGVLIDLSVSNLSFTANRILMPTDSGSRRVDNLGAVGVVSFTLPDAVPGLIFDIIQTAAQFIHVFPQQGDSIAISVGGIQNVATNGTEYVKHQLSTAGLYRTILCTTAGQWECMALLGTSSWIP